MMKKVFIGFGLMIVLTFSAAAQSAEDSKMIPIGPLPTELVENSGLVMIGPDDYVGMNDSGHGPELFVFSILRKGGTRKITVTNATNVDWEELTTDDEYLYIGDFGNNEGTRKDLTIYRVKIDDVKKLREIQADKITFSYPEQTKFKASTKTNFDCEAMVVVGDSLFLFTKNHGNGMTDVYGLLKVPGDYKAVHRGQFNAGGMVTGAAFRNKYGTNELALIGYRDRKKGYHPFIYHFKDFPDTHFFSGSYFLMNFFSSLQVESVLFKDFITIYTANEEENGDPGLIYKIALQNNQ